MVQLKYLEIDNPKTKYHTVGKGSKQKKPANGQRNWTHAKVLKEKNEWFSNHHFSGIYIIGNMLGFLLSEAPVTYWYVHQPPLVGAFGREEIHDSREVFDFLRCAFTYN